MEITVKEFKRMDTDDKLTVLFENQNMTIKQYANIASAQKFDRKILYTSLPIIAAILIFLLERR